MLGMVRSTLSTMLLEISDAPPETISVPAGEVEARVQLAKVQVMGIRDESKVWLNGSIPIWAIARIASQRYDHTMSLLAFGRTGARSEMP